MFIEIKELILKDVRLNWRERYAIYSLVLYVLCTSYVAYLSFEGIINDVLGSHYLDYCSFCCNEC